MAAQTGKANLLAKLGDKGRKAFDAHRNDETTYGNAQLPDGIEGGVAQLVECKFDTYKKGDNAGEIYFMASAVVKEPKEFKDSKGNVHRTEGQRTTIGPKLISKDGPSKTAEESIAWVLNELRKLGAVGDELKLENAEATALTLKQTQPHLKFRTWKGQPATEGPYKGKEPLTQHQWLGVMEYSGSSDDGQSAMVDNTGAAAPRAAANGHAGEGAGGYTDNSPLDTANLDTLLARANDQDGEAQDELERMAIAAGKTKKDVDGSPSWEQVVEWIKGGSGGGGNEGGSDAPEVGGNFKYSMPDPKNSKKTVKAEVEVLSVDEDKQTVTLKNLDTGKPIMDGKKAAQISWDKLEDYE